MLPIRLLGTWIVTLVALLAAPSLVRRARAGEQPQATLRVRSIGALALAVTIAAVLLAAGVGAATGLRKHPRFQMSPEAAQQAVASCLREIPECAICLSSTRGRIGLKP